MKELHKLFFIVTIGAGCCCVSCKKFVEIPPPKNELVTSAVFADSTNATAAVLGIYIHMMQSVSLSFSNGGLTLYPALSADELYPTGNTSEEKEFFMNSILPANPKNAALWANAYSLIYNANACIEGITSSTQLSASCKNQLLGETKFVRAFLYFHLVNLYGDVPLITGTAYHKNQVLGRSAVSDVYSSIVSDLTEAQSLLQSFQAIGGRSRPDVYAVSALMAKVYLFQKKWDLAEKNASKVINSGNYTLEAGLNNVFLASSNETVLKLLPVFPGIETWEGYYFVPANASALPRYAVTASLLNAFEPGDQRKTSWLKSSTVAGQPYYYPYKYKLGYDRLPIPKENYTVFRLAELYLIRAEARAQQGDFTGSLSDLNLVRKRAGLTDLSTTDLPTLLGAIEHERMIELFCEWGNRWLDLKRTGRADTILSVIKGSNWNVTDMLYPIPQSEITKNPSLTQNPGY
jgi:hypothetical protein